jgi:hypothetical protein
MNLVYYAHSYRKPDAPVIEFFSELMRSEQLIASLDPPSDRLNSAKPERHLKATDGMVAVLTAREGGVSPYILYEISLCLRANKPLLIFVEDTLPSGLISSRPAAPILPQSSPRLCGPDIRGGCEGESGNEYRSLTRWWGQTTI